MVKAEEKTHPKAEAQEQPTGLRGFLHRRGADIFLAVLVVYVILLGIGVFAEVFKIQSILNWWIWRAPGS